MSEDRAARSAAVVAGVAAFALVAQQVAGKAVRDGFFLSHFEATELPRVMIAAAGLAVAVVVVVGRLMSRFSPRKVAPGLIAVHAGLFVAEWALAQSHPRAAAGLVYLHTAGLGAAIISAFYSTVNERFDPHTAKRVIGRIAGGATAGGVAGGVGAWQLSEHLEIIDLLPALALIGIVALIAVLVFAGGAGHSDGEEEPTEGGLSVLARTPYLGYLALLVGLGAVADAVIDYVFKATAASAFDSPAELVSFFALFHTALGVTTFLVQLALTRRSLERLGLAATVASLPVAVVALGAVALVTPVLAVITGLRGGYGALENSLFRSGYELFYTPLPPSIKRPTKTLVDVGAEKLGAAAGSGLALVAVLGSEGVARMVLLGTGVVVALVMLWITRRLNEGYVGALADSLRSGSISLDPNDALDATTRQTLGDTTALDRRQLLAEIDALRHSGDGSTAESPAEPPSPKHPAAVIAGAERDPILAAIAELRSGDPARARAALRRNAPLDPRLVGHAVDLLAERGLLAPAIAALSSSLPRAAGQLGDALRDTETDVVVRRRLPRVLRASSDPRVVAALRAALEDPSFEVRYRSAAALLHISERDGAIGIDSGTIFELALDEVRRGGSEGLTDKDDAPTSFEREAAAHALDQTLTHVFTLLALVLDREPLHLAFCALGAADSALRGTGREYLDNVLPSELREALAPVLDKRSSSRLRRPRAADEIVRELQASTENLRIDPEILAKLRGGA